MYVCACVCVTETERESRVCVAEWGEIQAVMETGIWGAGAQAREDVPTCSLRVV